MKFKLRHFCLLCMAITGIVPAGCLFKPANVTTRHFILTSITTNDSAPFAADRLSVGIGMVKMPAYLLRDSLAVRTGTNEIEYFDSALWAERLDHCFQQTLAANLSKLLATDRIYVTDWARDQVRLCVFVNLQRFDVDTAGCGTLVAQWRITTSDSDTLLKSGQTRIVQAGTPPRGHPEAVAATLSVLTEKFGRELAQTITECAKSSR